MGILRVGACIVLGIVGWEIVKKYATEGTAKNAVKGVEDAAEEIKNAFDEIANDVKKFAKKMKESFEEEVKE